MKAISYVISLLAKQGRYGSRPKVEIPEKTESALRYHTVNFLTTNLGELEEKTNLRPTIPRQPIIPQRLMRTSNILLLIMVTMSYNHRRKAKKNKAFRDHFRFESLRFTGCGKGTNLHSSTRAELNLYGPIPTCTPRTRTNRIRIETYSIFITCSS